METIVFAKILLNKPTGDKVIVINQDLEIYINGQKINAKYMTYEHPEKTYKRLYENGKLSYADYTNKANNIPSYALYNLVINVKKTIAKTDD